MFSIRIALIIHYSSSCLTCPCNSVRANAVPIFKVDPPASGAPQNGPSRWKDVSEAAFWYLFHDSSQLSAETFLRLTFYLDSRFGCFRPLGIEVDVELS